MRSLVVSAAKNEAPYLLEWLAYHRQIGFDEALVVTNDNTDCTSELLGRLKDKYSWVHFIEHSIRSSDLPPQVQAYQLANVWLKERAFAGLVGVVDLDEVIFLKDHPTISDFFFSYEALHPDAIILNWRIFGSSGHKTKPAGLVIDNYTHCASSSFEEHQNFKCIFRWNDKVRRFNPHFPRFSCGTKAHYLFTNGSRINPNFFLEKPYTKYSTISLDVAQVNHYVLKSWEEFLMKRSRGRGAQSQDHAKLQPRHTEAFFFKMDQNAEVCELPSDLRSRVRDMVRQMYEDACLSTLAQPSYFGIIQ